MGVIRDNEVLRESFFALAVKTFGIDFKPWYEAGYWSEKYTPHTVIADGRVVANASVNTIDFEIDGENKRYIQIGTVMTEEAHKGLGYQRQLIEEIISEHGDSSDVIYLYANDTVLDFYPQFGFERAYEYEHSKEISGGRNSFTPLDINNPKQIELFREKYAEGNVFSKVQMINNFELIMFYCGSFLESYYLEELGVVVVGEVDGDELIIYDVFGKTDLDLDRIIEEFAPSEVKRVLLGFTPSDSNGYTIEVIDDDDEALFVLKGGVLEGDVRLPLLSHA